MSSPVDYFSADTLRQDLQQKTVLGGTYTAFGQVGTVIIGLAAVPVLTRLLDPTDFGLIAMVAVLINFARMYVDAGLSMATVQRESITPQQVTNLFWVAVGMGALATVVVGALAPVVAWFYNEPRLLTITVALATSFIMTGLTLQHQALMRRGMQFRDLAVVSTVSALVAQLAGIAWAYRYEGQPHAYWALVIIPLVMAAARMLGTWIACTWRPGLPAQGVGTGELVKFGLHLSGANTLNYLGRNLDNLAIGWWWGAAPLGYYERAYRLILLPMQQTIPVLSSVVIPALSRVRNDPEKYRKAYRAAVSILSWASIPLLGMLFAAAEPLVLVYMGAKWGPVVPLFRALIPVAWVTAFVPSSAWAFASWGHVDRQFRWSIYQSLIILPTIFACMPFGVFAVACGVSVVYFILRWPAFYYCFRGTPLKMQDITDAIWRPTLLAIAAAAITMLLDSWWLRQLPTWIELIACCGGYICVFVVGIFCLSGTTEDIRAMLQMLRRSQPTAPHASKAAQ